MFCVGRMLAALEFRAFLVLYEVVDTGAVHTQDL